MGLFENSVAKYKTIAELNEYWEDYTPKEPLIKDEKILKAVRAWAEANDIEKALFEYWWYSDLSAEMRVENYDNRSICIKFNVQKIICKANIIYTIEELCGEGNND